MNKVLQFTDLVAWQEGHQVVIEVYTLTRRFPHKETFIWAVRCREVLYPSPLINIVEGFSRKGRKEKMQFFYSMALGSLTELQNQLLIVKI